MPQPKPVQEDRLEALTVMHSMKAPGKNTTFATHMRGSNPPGVHVTFFDWSSALQTRYDVFHIHWPELLFSGQGKKYAALALIRVPLLLRKFRRERVAVVRTLHNMKPHESGRRINTLLTNALDRVVTRYISLNRVTEGLPDGTQVILHGDYIEQFSGLPRNPVVSGRVLYFGLVRPYKGIDALVSAFSSVAGPELSLRIVGRPNSPEMTNLVRDAERQDPRVSSHLEFVDDADLVREISEAELVVLPYKEMHNSGSLLVALSMGRPVLTRDSPVNRSIREEIGEEWMRFFTGDLDDQQLKDALEWVRASSSERSSTPAFDGRDWATVGRKHAELYRDAVSEVRHA